MPKLRSSLRLLPVLLLLLTLCAASTACASGWRYQTDAQGEEQWYWVPYASAKDAEDAESGDYHHPTFRGTAYGTKWNYSLTLGWAARPLWLYNGDAKILFRQQLESGNPSDLIQLTLWTRTHYPDMCLCMEPSVLEVLTRNGIDEILVQNGTDVENMVVTRYVVDSLLQMLEKTGLPLEDIAELWLGNEHARIVPVVGEAQRLPEGADGSMEVPITPAK